MSGTSPCPRKGSFAAMLLLSFLLWPLLFVEAARPFASSSIAGRRIHHHDRHLLLRNLVSVRGGEQDTASSMYTAIGIQAVGDIDALDSSSSCNDRDPTWLEQGPSCIVLTENESDHARLPFGLPFLDNDHNDNKQPSDNRLWRGDAAAVETLAICCDILVLVVVVSDHHDGPRVDPAFASALERGLQHRAKTGVLKSAVIVLVVSTSTSETATNSHDHVKDQLLLNEFSGLTPGLQVSSLDMFSLDDPHEVAVQLPAAWQEVLRDMADHPRQRMSHLVHVENFSQLARDTYRFKGGRRDEFMQQFVATPGTASETDNNNSPPSGEEVQAVFHQQETLSPATTDAVRVFHSREENEEEELALQAILVHAQTQLFELEAQQEELWLDPSTLDPSTVEFGPKANTILAQIEASVLGHVAANNDDGDDATGPSSVTADTTDVPKADNFTQRLYDQVLPKLKQLFDQHLQYLREHYGTQYEAVLDDTTTTSNNKNPDEYQAQWQKAAAQVTASFRQAAQRAVPALCREGEALRNANFDYVPALEGLLSDMMQATQDMEELLGISTLEDDEDNGDVSEADETGGFWKRLILGRRRRKRQRDRPAKWYEKVAAKAFVFGVNYLQGWLAYQGIKRAAVERDQHLPKFPLF